MRRLLSFALYAGIVAGSLSAATVGYTVQPLGGNLYRYLYNVTGAPLQLNQALDIVFEVLQYSSLTNGVASPGTGLSLLFFSPNPGLPSPGSYSLLATVNNPSMIGTFSIDFTFLGVGTPGSQAFRIDQYDSQGNNILNNVTSGQTSVLNAVPEPGTMMMGLVGVALAYAARSRKRTA